LLELIINAINKYRNSLEILDVLGYNEKSILQVPATAFLNVVCMIHSKSGRCWGHVQKCHLDKLKIAFVYLRTELGNLFNLCLFLRSLCRV